MKMQRTLIQADPELIARAKRVAEREGVSFAEIVRQGLEARLNQERPRPKSIGVGRSDNPDLATTLATEPAPPLE